MNSKKEESKATMPLDNYGDNFENGSINSDQKLKNSEKIENQKNSALIFIGIVFIIIITAFITLQFSSYCRILYNQSVTKKNTLLASSNFLITPQDKSLNNTENSNFFRYKEELSSATDQPYALLVPTEITPTDQITIATENVTKIVTEDQSQNSNIIDFILPDSTPTENITDYIQPTDSTINLTNDSKSIEVNNIDVKKINPNSYTIIITGKFNDYRADELMSFTKIDVTSGSYSFSSPSISEEMTIFSFVLNIKETSGIISINLDHYYFSQSISSIN